VAQIAAVCAPRRCAGLVLANSIGYDSWPIPSVKAMQATSSLLRRLPDPVFKQIFRGFVLRGHDDRVRAENAIQVHWPHYQRHGGAQAFARQVNSLNVNDTLAVSSELPRLGVPARIVWGAADGFQKIAYGERLARDLNAPLRRIEGGKHFTPEDHPEIVAMEIDRLLQDVKQASRS
jgi:pimeloyl-ACP methyl ester carboxylesterase